MDKHIKQSADARKTQNRANAETSKWSSVNDIIEQELWEYQCKRVKAKTAVRNINGHSKVQDLNETRKQKGLEIIEFSEGTFRKRLRKHRAMDKRLSLLRAALANWQTKMEQSEPRRWTCS